MKLRLLLTLLLAIGLSLPAFAEVGEVVAYTDFSAGNVSTNPDGYTGDIGNGWVGPWEEVSWVNSFASVETAGTPLYAGGGNYLTYGTANSGSTDGKMGVARDYGGPDFDPLSPYTISFSYRLDDGLEEAMAATNASTVDRVQFLGGPSGECSTAASSSYIIGAFGTNYGVWSGGPYWLLFDGTNDGVWDVNRLVNSGIAIAENTVYDFTIDVNPASRTYSATIAGGGSSFTATDLGWRGDSSTYATATYSYMSATSRTSEPGHAISSSLDGLTITQDLPDLGQMSEVVANFDTDTYPGTAGDGWKGGWTEQNRNDSLVTASVVSGNEVHAGDANCLGMTVSEGIGSVARNYRARPGINYKEDFQVEFTVRIDESQADLESNMTGYTDRYVISESFSQNVSTIGEDTFCIWSIGGEDGLWGSSEYVREWCFINGDQAGGIASMFDTDMDIVSGGVYDFTVTLNIDEQTYDVTVTNGTDTVTATGLGWRTGSKTVGGTLNFIGRCDSTGETRAMSVDNVRISNVAVPEPSTFVLLIGALLGLLIWRRK